MTLDFHVTTYLLQPHLSIKQAEMEEASPLSLPALTLQEAFGKPINPNSCLVLLLCPQALRHFGGTDIIIFRDHIYTYVVHQRAQLQILSLVYMQTLTNHKVSDSRVYAKGDYPQWNQVR